jgi:hypothetical protein
VIHAYARIACSSRDSSPQAEVHVSRSPQPDRELVRIAASARKWRRILAGQTQNGRVRAQAPPCSGRFADAFA